MLYIYKPEYEDLWFKEQMLKDEETMSYNHFYGGTILFPKSRWKEWYNKWIINPSNKRYYRYIKNDDEFVGEIAYHLDVTLNVYMCDVLIYSKYRKKGYGKQALEMLCKIARENGIDSLYDEIAIDNPSINMFIKQGFNIISKNEETIIIKKVL